MEHQCVLISKQSKELGNQMLELVKSTPETKYNGVFDKFYVIIKDPYHSNQIFNHGSFGYKIPSEDPNDGINLRLTLQEAFFLQFGLKCLNIYDENNKVLKTDECWTLFCATETDFVKYYVIYHYYRSRGWCPKSGTKYASDYVLYKNGPNHYHSSYAVVIDVDKESKYKWKQILPIVRVAETVKKDVIIARILTKNNVELNDIKSPEDMKLVAVHEMVISRWTLN